MYRISSRFYLPIAALLVVFVAFPALVAGRPQMNAGDDYTHEGRNNETPVTQVPASPLPVFVPYEGEHGKSRDGQCIDLVFVIDSTGSMGGAINNIKAGLVNILTLADNQSGGNLRAAVVAHWDDVHVLQAMTNDMVAVTTALNSLAASGGAGWPEASDEGLKELVSASGCLTTGDFLPGDWEPTCCKIAILVTDAPPGGCDDTYTVGVDDLAAQTVATDLANLGVQIGALHIMSEGVPDPQAAPLMLNYALATGGVYGELPADGQGTAEAIEQIILDCEGQASETELCCFSDGCTTVLQGQCEPLGGYVVDDCIDCDSVTVEPESWSGLKARFQ